MVGKTYNSAAKIVTADQAAVLARQVQERGGKVVFTNGCFDLLHVGHVWLLGRARELGNFLVLGLNSDASVKGLEKDPDRPYVPQEERALVAAGLAAVDAVVIFQEATPARLIQTLQPDVLVKGGDWPLDKIVGADSVRHRGGEVHSLPFKHQISTTRLVQRIRSGDEAP